EIVVVQGITVEPLYRVVIPVLPESARQRPGGGDVPRDLRKGGGIAVDALFVGEPNAVVSKAGYGVLLRQPLRVVRVRVSAGAGHHIVLPDFMHLTLGEDADGGLDGQLLRRADAQLV